MTGNRFVAGALPGLWQGLRNFFPRGEQIPKAAWNARHRTVVAVLYLHALGLSVFGFYMGWSAPYALGEPIILAAVAAVASIPVLGRAFRSTAAAFGMVSSSAVLTQFSGGYIEAHFHYFIVVALIALYQSWVPFLLAIVFVAVDHGAIGSLMPTWVYNHPDAIAHPWKWALIHAVLVLGECAAILAFWRLAERASERRDLVLRSAGEGIVGLDLSQRITFINPAAAQMVGRPEDALVGRGINEVLSGPQWSAALASASEAGVQELQTSQGEIVLPRGQTVPVEWTLTAAKRAGYVEGFVITLRDITDRRQAESQIQSTLSLLAATLESTADGLLVVDHTGKIRSFNRKFLEMWRIPDSILESRSDDRALEFVVRQLKDPEGFLRKVRELYADPKAESFDALEFRDGRIFERYSKPQFIEGRSVGRVWSFRDVTARVRAEEDRMRGVEQSRELERFKEMDRFKTQFLNSAAHELNTPLTPIKVQLHLLKNQMSGADASRDEKKSIAILDRNLERLSGLVQDLLDSARLQAGRLRFDLKPMRLNHTIADAVATFEQSARLHGLKLRFRPGPDLEVVADEKRTLQVLYNLLSNAIKFTPRGGNISVETRQQLGTGIVLVRDNGIGLQHEDIPKLFRPFSQIEDAKATTHVGTGLGLYISKSILEAQNGQIWCEAAGPSKGTTFGFSLPLAASPGVSGSSIFVDGGLEPPAARRPEAMKIPTAAAVPAGGQP